MGYKPTIIALVLAIVGVFAAWSVDRAESGADGSAAAMKPLVTQQQLPIDQVTRMTLSRSGEAAMVFVRDGLDWMQVEPFAFPMDRHSMRQLAAVAHQVQVVQRIAAADMDDDLTEEMLGLDPPAATVTYEWDGGELTLDFGRRGIGGRAYLRMSGSDDVLIVRQDLHERAVEMNEREWRDRTMFQDVGVESHRVERSDGLVLERDRRQWVIREPVATRADRQSVERYLQVLGGAQSGGFIADDPDDLQRFGLEPSLAHIDVFTGRNGEGQQRLHIGMPAGAGTQDRYGIVDGRPAVVRVPAAALQAIFIQPEGLIDPTGSGVEPADVRSLRIDGPDGTIEFVRDLERWRAPEHDGAEVPANYVEQLLSQLTQLRASHVRRQEYPRHLEVAMVTFFGFAGQPLDTVRIVHDESSDTWALENGDDVLRVFTGGFEPRLTLADFGLAPLPIGN